MDENLQPWQAAPIGHYVESFDLLKKSRSIAVVGDNLILPSCPSVWCHMHDWEGEGRSCLNVKFPRFVPTGNDVNAARFGMRCHDADSSHVDWARARARPSVPPGSRRAAASARARARSRCLGRGRSVRVGNGNLAYFSQQAGKGYRARVRQAGRLTQPEPVSPSVWRAATPLPQRIG